MMTMSNELMNHVIRDYIKKIFPSTAAVQSIDKVTDRDGNIQWQINVKVEKLDDGRIM